MIDWIQAAVLGTLQGLTEFVPVSSSAHLRIASALLGWDDPGSAFTAVTQLGTEAAVLVYFRHDIWKILRTWTSSLKDPHLRREPAARLGWYIILGTLPIAILGLALQNTIETAFRDLRLIGATLIVFGLLLGLADRVARNIRPLHDINMPDALTLGGAQALALIPGVSRSGGTIAAGLLLGCSRQAAGGFALNI